jgi:tetratricopeptide (TPR) repeat protein
MQAGVFCDMLKRPLTIGIALMLLLTLLTYANHFDNTFHFDDFHTVVNNANIRSLKNIPRFFTDGSTSSILPQNQAYRPVTVLSLAIDYWVMGDYSHNAFQIDTFILFLLQGCLMVFFFKRILDKSFPAGNNAWVAVLIVTLYMLHPANAETVNYIIARTDVQSTLFVIVAFVLYIFSPFCRKTYLYLVAVAIGILCKTTAVMFAPMLFCYILLFEMGISLPDVFKKANSSHTGKALLQSIPAFLVCVLLFWLTERMTPNTWQPGGTRSLQYLITQPFVILHYFGEFFLPTGLSADTDWGLLPSVLDLRFFAGCAFVLAMMIVAFYTSKKKETRPISFGILWFFLALIPTSSIIPLAEVLNDHRMYFPFIGLVLSVGWAINLLWRKYGSPQTLRVALSLILAVFACCAYGTYRRNQVWHDERSLWYDVTTKSPGNARGLMNYGLALYNDGDYAGAEKYLKKAEKLTPEYAVVYVNLGLVEALEGKRVLAENYYKAAIKLGSNTPDPYCYYAQFLEEEWRYNEAVPLLQQAIKISSLYLVPRTQLMYIYSMTGDWDKLKALAQQTMLLLPENTAASNYVRAAGEKKNELDVELDDIKKVPTAAAYADLSSIDYAAMRYAQCIVASDEALKLNPKYPEVYNNIGAACIKLHQYKKAVEALKKALLLKPGFAVAQNNLNNAYTAMKKQGNNSLDPLAADYINLSLYYFNEGRYMDCVDACNYALTLQPGYDLAYNNICAAYNKRGKYSEAIVAAQAGLKYNAQNQILKNNLAEALGKESMAHSR